MQAIFHEGDCAARARSTMVLIDRETRKARPLPEELIARLERLKLRAVIGELCLPLGHAHDQAVELVGHLDLAGEPRLGLTS